MASDVSIRHVSVTVQVTEDHQLIWPLFRLKMSRVALKIMKSHRTQCVRENVKGVRLHRRSQSCEEQHSTSK